VALQASKDGRSTRSTESRAYLKSACEIIHAQRGYIYFASIG
jgi:hypothetical protein